MGEKREGGEGWDDANLAPGEEDREGGSGGRVLSAGYAKESSAGVRESSS